MSSVRQGQPGATRVCPHCKATVLESAAICPGCRHHLRFATAGQQLAGVETYCAFSVDGTIAHTRAGEPCEYCIVLDVTNERGEQIMRQVVGVGALQPGELRRLSLSVDMLPLAKPLPKPQASVPPAGSREAAAAKPAARAPAASEPVTTPRPATAARSTAGVPASAPPPPAPAGAVTAKPGVGLVKPAAPAASPAPQPGAALGQRLGLFRKP